MHDPEVDGYGTVGQGVPMNPETLFWSVVSANYSPAEVVHLARLASLGMDVERTVRPKPELNKYAVTIRSPNNAYRCIFKAEDEDEACDRAAQMLSPDEWVSEVEEIEDDDGA